MTFDYFCHKKKYSWLFCHPLTHQIFKRPETTGKLLIVPFLNNMIARFLQLRNVSIFTPTTRHLLLKTCTHIHSLLILLVHTNKFSQSPVASESHAPHTYRHWRIQSCFYLRPYLTFDRYFITASRVNRFINIEF